MKLRTLSYLALTLLVFALPLRLFSEDAPWPIRVVIVTTFEAGNDTGDRPGEFQYWVEREHLDEVLPFAGGVHNLRVNH